MDNEVKRRNRQENSSLSFPVLHKLALRPKLFVITEGRVRDFSYPVSTLSSLSQSFIYIVFVLDKVYFISFP